MQKQVTPDMPVHSFIDRDEFSLLVRLVSENYTGKGIILDAGCFAGSSTLALCSGIPDQVLRTAKTRLLVAMDRFIVGDAYLINHFLETGEDIRYGESFLPIFLDTVSHLLPWIEVRAGEVTQVGRIEQPIEILFLDVAKTPALNAYALRNWFPRLTKSSIVIHQDFYSPAQPWIPTSMGALLDCFDVVTERVGETAVFRLLENPCATDLVAAGRFDQHQTSLQNIDRMIGRLNLENQAPLQISKAKILNRSGNAAEAKALMRRLLDAVPQPTMAKWQQWMASALLTIAPEYLDALPTGAHVINTRGRDPTAFQTR